MHNHTKKVIFALLWATLIGGFYFFWQKSGIAFDALPALLKAWVAHYGVFAPIVYILLYILRSLTFFSATVFTVTAGLLFGPWLGIVYTIIAENLSALFAYFVGRYLGSDVIRWLARHAKHFPSGKTFREHGFLNVLLMRLLFFPFDPVAYFAGAYRVRVGEFFLGTLIGTIPGLIAFVALGDLFAHPIKSLAIFLPFFIIGLVIAKALKNTQHGKALHALKQQHDV